MNPVIRIMAEMENKVDYTEFCNLCQAQNFQPMPLNDFLQKVGIVQYALFKYPDEAIENAINLTQKEMYDTYQQSRVVQDIQQGYQQRSCCGGGQTR